MYTKLFQLCIYPFPLSSALGGQNNDVCDFIMYIFDAKTNIQWLCSTILERAADVSCDFSAYLKKTQLAHPALTDTI